MYAPTFVTVSDGTKLEVEVVRRQQQGLETLQDVVAVLLHPWGPLGGQCRDPVVAAIFRRLIESGACCTRFNARGVGLSESAGRDSRRVAAGTSSPWAASLAASLSPASRNERDARDLVDVVAHALEAARGCSEDDDPDNDGRPRAARRRRVWLVGYSHGSLVASLALPLLRERLPLIDARAELAGAVAVAPPLGWLCSAFLGATRAFGPFAAAAGGEEGGDDGDGGGDGSSGGGGDDSARLVLLGTRDNFTSVAQLRAALAGGGFEFVDSHAEGPGEGEGGGQRWPRRRVRLLEGGDHFFWGRAGEAAEAAAAFVAEVEEEGEARRRGRRRQQQQQQQQHQGPS